MRHANVILATNILIWATGLIAVTSLAGTQEDAFRRLMVAESIRCVWQQGSSGDWEGGKLQAKLIPGDLPPSTFDAIDLKNKTARLIGNVGTADVLALSSPMGISFLEYTPIGNFNLTTVFADYSANGDFIAVTSRHVMLPKAPLVSQYHGVCKKPPWGPF